MKFKYIRTSEVLSGDEKEIMQFLIHEVKETSDEIMSYRGMNKEAVLAWLEKQVQKPTDIDNKFIRMRETKPKDISEFLDRLTTVEQEFLWEHIAKIRELDKEEQKSADNVEPKFKVGNTIVKNNSDINNIKVFTITDITGGKYWYNDRIICDITEQNEWTLFDVIY